MKLTLIDTHSHLSFPEFATDREAILLRMREKGVGTVTIGTTIGSSAECIKFAEAHDNVWASVGYHPEHFTSDYAGAGEEDKNDYSIDALRDLATSSEKVVAIGETGLDFFRIDQGRDIEIAKAKQEKGFRDHIRLAAELDLALVIHSREAFSRLADIIREEQGNGHQPRTVIHCFTGSWLDAEPLLALGCYLSFSGVITFPPKKTENPDLSVHRVIERIPLDRILIETDAPYLTPVPHRGEKNEPTYVEFIAQKIAELHKLPLTEIAKITTDNAMKAFNL